MSRVAPAAAWYAFTYRGRQVNGDSREITQFRRMHEVDRNAEEFAELLKAVAAAVNENVGGMFANATVNVIPRETYQINPMDAIRLYKSRGAELHQEPAVR